MDSPNPPPKSELITKDARGRSVFDRWLYGFWEWTAGVGTLGTLVLAGDALGTSTTGTLTAALSTTGVTAGTYGGPTVIPRFDISARGRVNSASNAGTLSTYGIATSLSLAGDALGTSPTNTLTAALSTTGVTAGTYGAARLTAQLVVDAKGRLSAASNAGTLGTFAGFDNLVGVGDLLGTTTTSTFTGALSTTGVAAGTYGGTGTFLQVVVDAKGRITSISSL